MTPGPATGPEVAPTRAAAGGTAPDVVTLGESMVAFRWPGPFGLGTPLVARLAGAESNVAIGLARLGHAVAWAGCVGEDAFGDLVLRELRAEGVDVRGVRRDPEAPTGLMFVEERTADVLRVEYRRAGSAGSRLHSSDAEAALDPAPRALHLTGITPALSESAAAAVTRAAELASAAGTLVALDVNHRSRLWTSDRARAVLRDLVPLVDVLIASEDELGLVADGDEDSAVSSLRADGVGRVVVKRGAAGSTLWGAAGRCDLPALAVTAVDVVGAGDAFCAGLLSGLLDGLEDEAAVARANALGAVAVSTRGDWEGLPLRRDLERLAGAAAGSTHR